MNKFEAKFYLYARFPQIYAKTVRVTGVVVNQILQRPKGSIPLDVLTIFNFTLNWKAKFDFAFDCFIFTSTPAHNSAQQLFAGPSYLA